MRSFTRALAVSGALSTSAAALAQTTTTTTNPLTALAGLGAGGLVILGVIAFVLWRFFFRGGSDD